MENFLLLGVPVLKHITVFQMPEGGDERLKFAFDNCSKYQPLHVFWATFWWPVLVCTHASTAKAMLKTTGLLQKKF